MKIREKRDEMLLTLALLEQLEKDDELKAFESYERWENNEGKRGAPGEKGHVFSEGHRERMEQLFKMAALQEKKKKRRRWMKKAAAGMAACLAVSVYMGFTSSAFRTPVLNFFTEVRETYSELLVDKDDKDGVTEHFQEYEPDYVVKGFYVSSLEEKKEYFKIYYTNTEGGWYYVTCYKMARSTYVDTEDIVEGNLEVGDKNARIYDKGSYTQLVLYEDMYQFSVIGNIEIEEMKQILMSIPKIN